MSLASDSIKIIKDRDRRDLMSATPERMAKTNEPFQSKLSWDDEGKSAETQIASQSPLERLHKAGALDGRNNDDALGNARFNAGEKYYGFWYFGELFPLASRDYRKPYTGSSDRFALLPAAERREHCRRKWREADQMFRSHGPLGLSHDRPGIVTHYIVIDEMPLAEVGWIVSRYRDQAQARAVATEFLIEGLDRLVELWRG